MNFCRDLGLGSAVLGGTGHGIDPLPASKLIARRFNVHRRTCNGRFPVRITK